VKYAVQSWEVPFSFLPCGAGSISCPVLRPPYGPSGSPRTIYTLHKGNSKNFLELNAN